LTGTDVLEEPATLKMKVNCTYLPTTLYSVISQRTVILTMVNIDVFKHIWTFFTQISSYKYYTGLHSLSAVPLPYTMFWKLICIFHHQVQAGGERQNPIKLELSKSSSLSQCTSYDSKMADTPDVSICNS
jgi:hypothetical protein